MVSSSKTAPQARGKVNWRRFAIIMLPSLAAAAALVVLTAQAVIAVSFSISGTPFTVTATQLKGQGFEQFGVIDQSVVKLQPGNTHQIFLTANVIRSATLSHLCQSVSVGGLNLRITAGNGSTPVTATDLVVDADQLSGSTASFTHINIGQDASTLTEVPGITGPPGDFAQQADTVTIDNLRQHAYATTAGVFTLPGFSLSFGGAC
jgi:uncharacterized protein DUF6230